ncbi:response regulator transcription factor [Opitutales bacterium]|nr:response regulator transcription factor [Opitutales bacterium]
MNKHPIAVLLVEDHVIVREGLRILLEIGGVCTVVGEASDGFQAVKMATKLHPDVIVMDIAMPGLNGFEATRQILHATPDAKVLVLSAHSDDEYVAHMAQLGATGFVVKQNSGQVLVNAVTTVANGQSYFSASIMNRIRRAERKAREEGQQTTLRNPLTIREAEVLQLVVEGLANKQVAAELGISIKTVEKHRQKLMDKLDIHDTAGLTRHAIATGVIENSVQNTTRPRRKTVSGKASARA